MSLHDALLAKAFGGGSGGTGGGGTSIDVTAEVGQTIIVKEVDASGKPTKWESADYQPRTHYKTTEYLIPETTIEGSGFETLAPALLVEGETYIVNWDGVDYTCTALGVSMDGMPAVFIGNAIILGGDNTGEPFVIGTMLAEGNKVAMGASVDDTVESFTFSIKGYVYTPIPVQYVTNAFPYCVELSAEYYDDGIIKNLTCAESGQTLLKLYNSGQDIILRRPEYKGDSNITSWVLYRLAGFSRIDDGTIAFSFTAGQILQNKDYHPVITIGITPDGQIVITSRYH